MSSAGQDNIGDLGGYAFQPQHPCVVLRSARNRSYYIYLAECYALRVHFGVSMA